MEATEKNFAIVDEVMKTLGKNNCTVKQAEEILSYVAHMIRSTSTVQP